MQAPLTIYRQNAGKLRLMGIKDELKHLDREIKKNAPDLRKVMMKLVYSKDLAELLFVYRFKPRLTI